MRSRRMRESFAREADQVGVVSSPALVGLQQKTLPKIWPKTLPISPTGPSFWTTWRQDSDDEEMEKWEEKLMQMEDR